MQVNNNFNRFSAPQFGMALRIKPGAKRFLQKQSMDTLERLKNIGNDIANFKHFDLEVGEHGYAVRLKDNATYIKNSNPNRTPENPNYVGFSFWDIDFPTEVELDRFRKKYYKVGSSELSREVLVMNALEKQYNRLLGIAEPNAETLHNNAVENLINRFGTNA